MLGAISGKCKLVRKPHVNLPDTQVDFTTSAPKQFQMLPDLPGAEESVLEGFCKDVCASVRQYKDTVAHVD